MIASVSQGDPVVDDGGIISYGMHVFKQQPDGVPAAGPGDCLLRKGRACHPSVRRNKKDAKSSPKQTAPIVINRTIQFHRHNKARHFSVPGFHNPVVPVSFSHPGRMAFVYASCIPAPSDWLFRRNSLGETPAALRNTRRKLE